MGHRRKVLGAGTASLLLLGVSLAPPASADLIAGDLQNDVAGAVQNGPTVTRATLPMSDTSFWWLESRSGDVIAGCNASPDDPVRLTISASPAVGLFGGASSAETTVTGCTPGGVSATPAVAAALPYTLPADTPLGRIALTGTGSGGKRSSSGATGTYVTKTMNINVNPRAPGALTASPRSDGGAAVTWQPSPDHDDLTGYQVRRRAVTGAYADWASPTAEVPEASYTDSGLTAGQGYCYQVRAVVRQTVLNGATTSAVVFPSGQPAEACVTTAAVSATSVTVPAQEALYSEQATTLTLTATVGSPTVASIGTGSVTFAVRSLDGTLLGAEATDDVLDQGSAEASYALPGGLSTGDYRVVATYAPGPGLSGSSGEGVLTVRPRPTSTTINASQVVLGAQSVELTALVAATGSSVGSGSVSFQLRTTGGTAVGTAVTDASVIAGAASVSYPLPAGMLAGQYSIRADYTSGGGFADSSAERARGLSVLFRWDGFLQPINDTAHQIGVSTSSFKAGSTVPVKFRLKDSAGGTVLSVLPVRFTTPVRVAPGAGPVSEPTYTDPGDTGDTFRESGGQYQYNWKTGKEMAGSTYRLTVRLEDGSSRTVDLSLR